MLKPVFAIALALLPVPATAEVEVWGQPMRNPEAACVVLFYEAKARNPELFLGSKDAFLLLNNDGAVQLKCLFTLTYPGADEPVKYVFAYRGNRGKTDHSVFVELWERVGRSPPIHE